MEERKPFRRKQFLINRAFQIKYTVIIAVIGIIIAILWGTLFYKASRDNSQQMLMLVQMDPNLSSMTDIIKEKLAAEDNKIMLYLIAFVIAIFLSLVIWGILITHRIAGPIFIISKYVDSITYGKIPETRPLRKKDELKEFFEKFNKMLESLKERENIDIVVLNDVLKNLEGIKDSIPIDKRPEIEKGISELSKVIERKKEFIK
ncbi:MAG: methyl-accepting chemotaxis protein [Deltaproteobacteria bacterium]|nr:methyl-accepting chemotaxis protein [Deltaproteobacteria bacterium]